jgi:SAM-dependent methyltransferase
VLCVELHVTKPEYVLGSDDTEIERLQAQAAIIAEPTAILFERGGIRPGMRVLDLGSGPGDVSFLVADIVGENGSVVGVEQDPAQIAVATGRRDSLGLANVDFRRGDVRTFVDDEPFDAAVCRLLLMHLPDAADVLAHQLRNLRSGGVFVAVDYDLGGARALPEVGLYSSVSDWLKAGFEHAHVDAFVGMRLPVLFGAAGYADIGSLGLQAYWPPEDRLGLGYVVGVVRAMKDVIIASGAATEDELGLDTLEERLGDAVATARAVYTATTVVGGWGRRP